MKSPGLAVQVPVASPGVWLMAARPKTLIAGTVPFLVATALAHRHGESRLLPAVLTFVCAMLIQVGINLANDYYDFVRGADTAERLGPPRVTANGLIAPDQVRNGAWVCFGLALALSGGLSVWGGWTVVVLAAVSVLIGFTYTGGPFPLGYHGLGDVFVFLLFGFTWVAWGYYGQTGMLEETVWWAAIPVGASATALLVVNNLRDIGTDEKAGKRTLAVRFGARMARVQYTALVALTLVSPVVMWGLGLAGPWVLLALLSLPVAFRPLRLVLTRSGAELNAALGATARLQLVFGVLFSLGLVLG